MQKDLAVDVGYPLSYIQAPGPKRDEVKDMVQQDFAKADVYFQTLNVQSIMQEKKYSVRIWNLIAKHFFYLANIYSVQS